MLPIRTVEGGQRRREGIFRGAATAAASASTIFAEPTDSEAAFEAYQRRNETELSAIDFNILVGLINESIRRAKLAENCDAILFVGKTGAGKTTLLHWLSGSTLESDDEEAESRLRVTVTQIPEARIGEDPLLSETTHPLVVPVPNSSLVYIDLPGASDTRKREIEKKLCASVA